MTTALPDFFINMIILWLDVKIAAANVKCLKGEDVTKNNNNENTAFIPS